MTAPTVHSSSSPSDNIVVFRRTDTSEDHASRRIHLDHLYGPGAAWSLTVGRLQFAHLQRVSAPGQRLADRGRQNLRHNKSVSRRVWIVRLAKARSGDRRSFESLLKIHAEFD